jgi:hypothetical protein
MYARKLLLLCVLCGLHLGGGGGMEPNLTTVKKRHTVVACIGNNLCQSQSAYICRIGAAQAKIDKLKEIRKAVVVFSSAKDCNRSADHFAVSS